MFSSCAQDYSKPQPMKSLSSEKQDKDFKTYYMLIAFLDCFWQEAMRTLWKWVQKCMCSLLYLVICLGSFLTFYSWRSSVVTAFWRTCFDFSSALTIFCTHEIAGCPGQILNVMNDAESLCVSMWIYWSGWDGVNFPHSSLHSAVV